MKNIKVLGPGCARCATTAELILQAAAERGVEIELEKIQDFAEIAKCGVMSTPAVIIDGRVVHAGGIPAREKVDTWL
ncbi:MAG: thioredoxin family protein [Betaproteobacteria bacterium]